MYRSIVLCLIVSSSATAQEPHSNFHLSFEEIDAVTGLPVPNPNGIIEPGEAARISLAVSFAPPVGAPVSHPWLPPGNWTVHALGGPLVRLTNTSFQDFGTWTNLQIAPGWLGSAGWVTSGGRDIINIRPSQWYKATDQSNPVNDIWQGTWVPNDHTDRIVSFIAWDSNFVPLTFLWARERSTGSFEPILAPPIQGGRVFIPVGPGYCYANCDASTEEPKLTVDDFTCFINEFAGALVLPYEQQVEHYANCDGSTTVPVLTVDDFTCFINEFAAGCP